jgi:hypothetical protein
MHVRPRDVTCLVRTRSASRRIVANARPSTVRGLDAMSNEASYPKRKRSRFARIRAGERQNFSSGIIMRLH